VDLASVTVQIAAAEVVADPGGLAQTGVDLDWAPWVLGLAVLLMLAGGITLIIRRRLVD
jgi:hypothetical protein